MAVLDGDIGDVIQCNRCGVITNFDGSGESVASNLWRDIFFKKHKPFNGSDFCHECAVIVTPLIYKLRDIVELQSFVNKLERAIREKRTKNNRPVKDNACQCCQGCAKRGS